MQQDKILNIEEAFERAKDYKKSLEDIGELINSEEEIKNISSNALSLWNLMEPSMATYIYPQIYSKTQKFNLKSKLKIFISYFFSKETLSRKKDLRTADIRDNTVLFICFEKRQIEGAREMISEIQQYGKKAILITSSVMNLDSLDYFDGVVTIESFFTKLQRKNIHKEEKLYTKKAKYIFRSIDKCENKMKGRLTSFLSSNLRIHYYLSRYLKYLVLAEEVLKEFSSPIIFSFDETDPRIRAFFIQAKKNGLTSIYSQFGLQTKRDIELSYSIASDICFFGKSYFDLGRAMGLESNFHATGCLRYDQLNSVSKKEIAYINQLYPQSLGKKLILFASQPDFGDSFFLVGNKNKLIKELVKSVKKDNLFLIVRPHPDEDIRKLLENFSGLNEENHAVCKTANFSTLMKSTDVLVTFFSTCILESIILDKKIILLGEHKNEFYDFYSKEAGALQCSSSDEINRALFQDENNNMRSEFMDNHLLNFDGLSYQRMAKIVVQDV
ncbi:CDP-glycerol glycerophosphotransferase family protein [Gammaproteobacteria bacterium]|nr:CDP-glycerol glycerophosphotransferase family protein [Gammaproteobacteria bacterium]